MKHSLDHIGGDSHITAYLPQGVLTPVAPSCESIFGELRAAAASLERQLPYFLATASSENCLRDALAYQLHTKYRNVAREHRVKREGKNIVADIAILSNSGREPKTIIELKQLYLKELRTRREGHIYVDNIVKDLLRWSACRDVFGVVLVRRICAGTELPCANGDAHVYLERDRRFETGGVQRMHDIVRTLTCAVEHHPTKWEEARIHPQCQPKFGVELYGWVIRRL